MIPQQMEFDFNSPLTYSRKFDEFHRANSQVFENLERLASRLIERGQKQIGIGYLFEVLRYELFLQSSDPNSDFKLNNNYRSRYSRLLLAKNPNWRGIIQIRELRSQ